MSKDFNLPLTILLIISVTRFTLLSQCNGYESLCDKKYNEVSYLTTHNAYNSAQDGYNLPNQNYNIRTQLNNGIRAFMLDVYDFMGTISVYHGVAILGNKPLQNYLVDIRDFLQQNPKEVITIILECYVDADDIENELYQAGLDSFLYAHDSSSNWPTLQQLINWDQRLLIFSDKDDANNSQNWYHYMWDYMVETHYSANDTSDFTCDFNRGNPSNDLFILNHFITNNTTGTGNANQSLICNSNPFFINRVVNCQQEKNKFPNFLTVDFYELGDCYEVLNQINNIPAKVNTLNDPELLIYPNPFGNRMSVQFPNNNAPYTIHIFDIQGNIVKSKYGRGSSAKLCKGRLAPGQYIFQVQTQNNIFKNKVIIQ